MTSSYHALLQSWVRYLAHPLDFDRSIPTASRQMTFGMQPYESLVSQAIADLPASLARPWATVPVLYTVAVTVTDLVASYGIGPAVLATVRLLRHRVPRSPGTVSRHDRGQLK